MLWFVVRIGTFEYDKFLHAEKYLLTDYSSLYLLVWFTIFRFYKSTINSMGVYNKPHIRIFFTCIIYKPEELS